MMCENESNFRNGNGEKRVKVVTWFVFSLFGVYDMVDTVVCAFRLLRNPIRKRNRPSPTGL